MRLAAVFVRVGGDWVPEPDCGDRNRLTGEYIGYTYAHLPKWSWDWLRNADAIFAIFAARMALSSLEIRGALK